MLLSRILAIGTAAVVLLMAPPAHADQDVARVWHSDSLRDNDVGYWLEISPVAGPSDAFTGRLHFTHRGGRRGSTTPIRMTMDGRQITLTSTQGAFDRSSGPLRAVMNSSGTRLRLTNCQARLQLVMANDLASDCTLRPAR